MQLPLSNGCLTTREAAAFLRLSYSTLTKQRLTGSGPRFLKLGKSVRYRIPELVAWQNANLQASTTETRI